MTAPVRLDDLDPANPGDRALRAAIEFLIERDRWVKALQTHRSGSYGLCSLHSEPWPCWLFRLAEAARNTLIHPPAWTPPPRRPS